MTTLHVSNLQHLKDEVICLRLLIRQNSPEVVTFWHLLICLVTFAAI
jgi:hypothetical protein